uniref:Non-haem dioxygenase N-terminal domain-containing protein n=1 Tax=Oryza punctata TaxID=4537 RepID=A0A0E0LUL4_ORYPU
MPSTTPRLASRASSTLASPPSPTSSATSPTPSPSPHRRKPRRPSPVIDLAKADVDRDHVVSQVRSAAESAGLFQVVNHGVAGELMDEMLAAVRRFNEQHVEAKAPYHTRDLGSKVRFFSNFDLFQSPAAQWRDTVYVEMVPDAPSPEEIPPPFRGVAEEFSAAVWRLGERVTELLSEALGLPAGYLARDAGCMDGMSMAAQYYPPCPEPEKTMGTSARHGTPTRASSPFCSRTRPAACRRCSRGRRSGLTI